MPAVMFLDFHELIQVASSYYITVLQCNPKDCFRMSLRDSHYLCIVTENHFRGMSRCRDDLRFIGFSQLKQRKTIHCWDSFIVKANPQNPHGKLACVIPINNILEKRMALCYLHFVITKSLLVLPVPRMMPRVISARDGAPFPCGCPHSCLAPSVHSDQCPYFKYFSCKLQC